MSGSEILREVFRETSWQQGKDERWGQPEGRRGGCKVWGGQAKFLRLLRGRWKEEGNGRGRDGQGRRPIGPGTARLGERGGRDSGGLQACGQQLGGVLPYHRAGELRGASLGRAKRAP